jgi:phage baseplate assembly protein W
MRGMNASTGAPIEGEAHLGQSITDILTTPIGSRVMRRDYGSLLFDLIDYPYNATTRALLNAATAIALARWEPRLLLRRVLIILGVTPGTVLLSLEGERTDRPGPNNFVRLTLPLRLSGDSAAA